MIEAEDNFLKELNRQKLENPELFYKKRCDLINAEWNQPLRDRIRHVIFDIKSKIPMFFKV